MEEVSEEDGPELMELARQIEELERQEKLEKQELQQLEKAKKNLASIQGKLSNEKFTARAPESVVNAEREKAQKAALLIDQLEQSLAALQKL